jgi:hypothetical protein
VFLQTTATVITAHTVSNNVTAALLPSCSQYLHLTAAEEMIKKIKENSFLETVSV